MVICRDNVPCMGALGLVHGCMGALVHAALVHNGLGLVRWCIVHAAS